MENPNNQPSDTVGLTEDPPPPPSSSNLDQSTSESLGDSSGRRRPAHPPLSPLTGCYLLIVIGEPHSERHKEIILQKIAKGKMKIFFTLHEKGKARERESEKKIKLFKTGYFMGL